MAAAGQGVLGIGIKIFSFLAILRRVITDCLALVKQATPRRQPVGRAIHSTQVIATSIAIAATDGVTTSMVPTAVVRQLKPREALGEGAVEMSAAFHFGHPTA